MWRSWENVYWASIGCWTTIITTVIAQWRSRLNACVRMNGGHFQHKMSLWLLLCFVCFIDTGFCKCDRYKHVQSANIVWNVLLLCLTLSHGMVATQRTCGRKFLLQWLRHSLVKLCTKNYENPSIFVKVTAKKWVAPFFYLDTVYIRLGLWKGRLTLLLSRKYDAFHHCVRRWPIKAPSNKSP